MCVCVSVSVCLCDSITGDFVLNFCQYFDVFFHYFLTKKTKQFFDCGRPTGHNFGHPLYRKQTFFKG